MRKGIVISALLAAGVATGYLFYLSSAFGFAVSKFCGGKREGHRGRVKSLLVPVRGHHVHLHHWLVSAIVAAVAAVQGFSVLHPHLFYGFLSGMAFQGIYCYRDWHRVIKKRFPIEICPVAGPVPVESLESA